VGFFQSSIENRLSTLLGMEVRFEKVSFSLLGGSIDVLGVVIGGNGAVMPLVTIRRVRAEFALAAALKKEFVIKSLTLERPLVSLARDSNAGWNLPTSDRQTCLPARLTRMQSKMSKGLGNSPPEKR
jgi:uncharacterized protein involved in outer membrane biogenesis